MNNKTVTFMLGIVISVTSFHALAWDHPGHMTTAAIAYK